MKRQKQWFIGGSLVVLLGLMWGRYAVHILPSGAARVNEGAVVQRTDSDEQAIKAFLAQNTRDGRIITGIVPYNPSSTRAVNRGENGYTVQYTFKDVNGATLPREDLICLYNGKVFGWYNAVVPRFCEFPENAPPEETAVLHADILRLFRFPADSPPDCGCPRTGKAGLPDFGQ